MLTLKSNLDFLRHKNNPPVPQFSTCWKPFSEPESARALWGPCQPHLSLCQEPPESVLLSSCSGSLMPSRSQIFLHQRQMAKSRCQANGEVMHFYNGMSYGSLSPKLAAASCRLVLAIAASQLYKLEQDEGELLLAWGFLAGSTLNHNRWPWAPSHVWDNITDPESPTLQDTSPSNPCKNPAHGQT